MFTRVSLPGGFDLGNGKTLLLSFKEGLLGFIGTKVLTHSQIFVMYTIDNLLAMSTNDYIVHERLQEGSRWAVTEQS